MKLHIARLTSVLLSLVTVFVFATLSAPHGWTLEPLEPYEQTQEDARNLKVGSSNLVGRWPQSAKRFALIIGVDEYLQDPQISKLAGAGNDAKALAEALVKYAGFPKDQVLVLTCDQPPDRWPTRSNILRRLSNLRRTVPEDGLVLVFFAGHGMEREGHAFLLPADAQLSGDIGLLEDTAIDAEVIKERIRQIRIGQVVIILDACRTDPLGGRDGADNPLTEAYTRSLNFDARNLDVIAFATLYATELGSRSFEYKEKAHGYFTWGLLEGLKGAAANESGEVTLKSLVDYLQTEVPKRTSIDLGASKKQRPIAVIEGYKADEFVLASPGPSRLSSLRAGTPGILNSSEKERVFWDLIKGSKKPFAFLTYLDLYPNGDFAALATKTLEILREEERQHRPKFMTATFVSMVAATWDVNLSSPQGNRTFSLIIKEAVTEFDDKPPFRRNPQYRPGRFVGMIRSMNRERPLSSITLNGREITFVDKTVLQGREMVFTFKGVIDADFVMKGEADLGSLGRGQWSAVQHEFEFRRVKNRRS